MFYLNNSISQHRFITATDSSSEETWVGYMLWELNLFSMTLVIWNSLQQIFLAWRKDFWRYMESKVLICMVSAYLAFTKVTREKHLSTNALETGKLRMFRKYVDSSEKGLVPSSMVYSETWNQNSAASPGISFFREEIQSTYLIFLIDFHCARWLQTLEIGTGISKTTFINFIDFKFRY